MFPTEKSKWLVLDSLLSFNGGRTARHSYKTCWLKSLPILLLLDVNTRKAVFKKDVDLAILSDSP